MIPLDACEPFLTSVPYSYTQVRMLRFLLVSNHAGSLKGQVDQIEREGFEAEIADGPGHLQAALAAGSFDSVLIYSSNEELILPELVSKTLMGFPKLLITVITAKPAVAEAVAVMKAGAFEYLQRETQESENKQLHGILAAIARKVRSQRMEERVDALERRFNIQSLGICLTSRDNRVQQILDTAFQSYTSTDPVLILGSSGVGKSVLAHAIHHRGSRSETPFIEVHCSNPSATALHAEIFGHAEGTLAGVPRMEPGKIASAEGGTIFLHEIGDMPLDVQHEVLKLITDGVYHRLGESHARPTRIRILASSHHNLRNKTEKGEFLPALLARLTRLVISMPPLNERASDVPIFAETFLTFFSTQTAKNIRGFSKPAWRRLVEYPWPGNLRELRNTIEQAVIRCQSPYIEIADLPDHVSGIKPGRLQVGENASLSDLEFEHIRLVLARAKTLDGAAKTLGIDPATLYRKRKKMNL